MRSTRQHDCSQEPQPKGKPLSRRELLGSGSAALLAMGMSAAPIIQPQASAFHRGTPSDSDIDAFVNGLLPQSATPGLSLAVVREGQVAYAQGYGRADLATGRPVTPQTVFQSASLTKPAFAYAVLKLCERGQLRLDTPLNAYAPASLICRDPSAQRITTRHALTHSSGLPNWTNGKRPMDLQFAPGESFSYSSEGYLYLQDAVERVAGRTLRDLMDQSVLGPAGMRDSSMIWMPAHESTAATGYDWDLTPVESVSKPTEAGAASTLHTTASDYAMLLCTLLLPHGPDAYRLDYVSERMMLSPQVRLNAGGLAWGLGWGLHLSDEGDRFWHWGDSRGFMSYVMGSRVDKSAVAIFTNGRHGLRLCHKVAEFIMGGQEPVFRWIYDVFYEGKLREWPAPAPAPAPAPTKRRRKGSR